MAARLYEVCESAEIKNIIMILLTKENIPFRRTVLFFQRIIGIEWPEWVYTKKGRAAGQKIILYRRIEI